jgi:hypothetical protein
MKVHKDFALVLVGLLLAGVQAPAALGKELSDQQKLIERMKIEDLLSRSAWDFDTHDIDAWIGTFAPDGEWDTAYVTCKGPEALRAYATKGFNCAGVPGGAHVPGAPASPFASARGPADTTPNGPPANAVIAGASSASNGAAPGGSGPTGSGPGANKAAEHFVSDPVYEFVDDHTCHYKAYWMTVFGGGEQVGGQIVSVGHYDDTIVKINGRWLIQKRQILH